MIVEIKAAFKNNLPNLQWMDPSTRKAAVEKVCHMVLKNLFYYHIMMKITRNSKKKCELLQKNMMNITTFSVDVHEHCGGMSISEKNIIKKLMPPQILSRNVISHLMKVCTKLLLFSIIIIIPYNW